MRNTPRSKSSGQSRKPDEIDHLVAESHKVYLSVASRVSKLLTRKSSAPETANRWIDVEVVKAIAVLEEGGRPARLCDVVGVIDSWQHMILRPDELADSVPSGSAGN